MTEFTYKEIDTAGVDTLNALAEADKFNAWMYQTIAPHLKGNILEIGSGIGNLSEYFLKNNASIWLSDIRLNYCQYLTNKFAGKSGVREILQMDLIDPQFDSKFSYLFNSFDSIFALNVVEHIQDDDLAIKNCRKLLKAGGKLLILVPAYQWLYNKFDKELEHYRRYTKRSLSQLIAKYFTVLHAQYFNLAGIAGWFISGSVMKKKIIPTSQVRIYNKLVPAFRLIDKLTFNQVGLSVIVVGEKTNAAS